MKTDRATFWPMGLGMVESPLVSEWSDRTIPNSFGGVGGWPVQPPPKGQKGVAATVGGSTTSNIDGSILTLLMALIWTPFLVRRNMRK